MKKLSAILLAAIFALTGCVSVPSSGNVGTAQNVASETHYENAVNIAFDENSITVDGKDISDDASSAVYKANDIIYYPEGKDFTFGEGTAEDEHSEQEAAMHTVVHITKPGTYALSGTLPYGQIAVDLGDEAEENPDAKVTLILNGLDITCTVAPAVIFYNVYECSEADEETASKDIDTLGAGASVIIADNTVNNVNGSYVARIYKSVELNEDGTEVIDSKKLHKYDAAFYSKMTMNVNGGEIGNGVLNINAENEGLDSELHLTINGGNINITAGNDGINTNEDYISVTTLNGGNLNIVVTGTTGEGDGIDSNGWLVINGGSLTSSACGTSGDAGIDSDMGIYINGGSISASGNMLDRISGGDATYAVFSFANRQSGGKTYTLKNESGEAVFESTPVNNFSYLIISDEKLTPGTYTLWCGDVQLAGITGGPIGFGGRPGGFDGIVPGGKRMDEETVKRLNEELNHAINAEGIPEFPNRPPHEHHNPEFPQREAPENMPEFENGDRPQGGNRGDRQNFNPADAELSAEFVIAEGGNYFNMVSEQAK